MSDDQVDLDAMIKSDRKRRHIEKERKRQQRRYQSRSYRDSHHRNKFQNRRRDDRRDRRNIPSRRKSYREQRNKKQIVVENYAISAQGFVSDVSLDDILKLAKGKKIINIKASLSRQDNEPLQPGKDTNMKVIINFVQKQEANDFIKQYSDKKLDGKNSLQFQFRRGLITRKRRKDQIESEQGNAVRVEPKQQEENGKDAQN